MPRSSAATKKSCDIHKQTVKTGDAMQSHTGLHIVPGLESKMGWAGKGKLFFIEKTNSYRNIAFSIVSLQIRLQFRMYPSVYQYRLTSVLTIWIPSLIKSNKKL